MMKFFKYLKLQDTSVFLFTTILFAYPICNSFYKMITYNVKATSIEPSLNIVAQLVSSLFFYYVVLKLLYTLVGKWSVHIILNYVKPVALFIILSYIINSIKLTEKSMYFVLRDISKQLLFLSSMMYGASITIINGIYPIFTESVISDRLRNIFSRFQGFERKPFIKMIIRLFRIQISMTIAYCMLLVILLLIVMSILLLNSLFSPIDAISEAIGYILVYLVIIIAFLLAVLSAPKNQKFRHKKIEINLLNLKFLDIIEKGFYTESTSKALKKGRLFKIDFTESFPELDFDFQIAVLNKLFIKNSFINNVKSNEKNFYFFCDSNSFPLTHNLEILLIKKGTHYFFNKYYKFNLLMKFDQLGEEIIVDRCEIVFFRKLFLNFDTFIKSGSYLTLTDLTIFRNCYHYNSELSENNKGLLLSERIHSNRKWLIHNGDFGCGKTALDALTVSEARKIPVIISPWEDNYDNDILFLIYQRIMRNTNFLRKFVGNVAKDV